MSGWGEKGEGEECKAGVRVGSEEREGGSERQEGKGERRERGGGERQGVRG